MKSVLIIGVLPVSIINFRADLVKDLIAKGYDVTVMASSATIAEIEAIEALGCCYIDYPLQRTGMNPFSDLKALLAIYKALKSVKPDCVLSYTIKPVVWGGVASRLYGKADFFALVTGLGFTFNKLGFSGFLIKSLVCFLYRMGLKNAKGIIFQNPDNRNVFKRNRLFSAPNLVVNGSGVNLEHFKWNNPPEQGMNFLVIARLLGDKGLREYAQAAEFVKKKYPGVNFWLVGPEDESPDGISIEEVESWKAVEYLGATDDVRKFIKECHVFCLPSYHEGLPRTVIEAMSVGRPILTTDAPGCKETVVCNDNGFLVPIKSVAELAEKMEWFVCHRSELAGMGEKSREMAESLFDVHKVNAAMIDFIEERDA